MTHHAESLASRATNLHAIGQDDLALSLVIPLSWAEPDVGLELAVCFARTLIEEQPAGPDQIIDVHHALPPECARLAFPVVTEVIRLTRGHHEGALTTLWHRVSRHARTDSLATLLALSGQARRHPERN